MKNLSGIHLTLIPKIPLSHTGSTSNCRESLAAFMAWVERCVAKEKAQLNTDKAVSYCDEWAKHGGKRPAAIDRLGGIW